MTPQRLTTAIILLVLLMTVGQSIATEHQRFIITGNLKGAIKDCKCPNGQPGGLARRLTIIRQLQHEAPYKNTVIDCGRITGENPDSLELALTMDIYRDIYYNFVNCYLIDYHQLTFGGKYTYYDTLTGDHGYWNDPRYRQRFSAMCSRKNFREMSNLTDSLKDIPYLPLPFMLQGLDLPYFHDVVDKDSVSTLQLIIGDYPIPFTSADSFHVFRIENFRRQNDHFNIMSMKGVCKNTFDLQTAPFDQDFMFASMGDGLSKFYHTELSNTVEPFPKQFSEKGLSINIRNLIETDEYIEPTEVVDLNDSAYAELDLLILGGGGYIEPEVIKVNNTLVAHPGMFGGHVLAVDIWSEDGHSISRFEWQAIPTESALPDSGAQAKINSVYQTLEGHRNMANKAKVFSAIFIVLTICLLVFAGGFGNCLFLKPNLTGGDGSISIEIKQGASLSSIASQLVEAKIIQNRKYFKIAARLMRAERKIQSGVFTVPFGASNLKLLRILMKPGIQTQNVTIPEGLTVRQIAGILADKMGIDSTKFVELCKSDTFAASLNIPANRLEGYLYPETYNFYRQTSEKDIIQRMVAHYHATFDSNMKVAAKKLGLSEHEAVTLATIIQGEVMVWSEAALVSSVYHNRLKQRMKLGADPTIQYIIPDGPRRLLNKDLEIISPYNTYMYRGLPPGPISNPGKQAMYAAVHPAASDYVFFVAKGDGTHYFNSTYNGHIRDKKKLQKIRNEVARKKRNR